MAVEKIIISGAGEIMKPVLNSISEVIGGAWGVKSDLKKLKQTIESIQVVVTRAEENQANDPDVGIWLRRLKSVMYDAKDMMDDLSYQKIHRGKHKVRSLVSSSNPILFSFKMAPRIQAINDKLDEIYKNMKRYRLPNTTSKVKDNQMIERRNRLTSADIYDPIVLGREGAISDLTKLLIQSSSEISSQPQKLPVSTLSIVGMGGLGKTTVAQMIYKDDSIVRNFEQRIWVCVSDTFDIYKILKDVLESICGGRKCEDPSNVDVLARQVKDKLAGKKYLLVLDDLWNEDVADWGKLKNVLVYGGFGSKVLVTTRNRKVASTVGGTIYNLEKLSDEACWSIIEKKVMIQEGAAVLTPKMMNIGMDIAERCDGLPLAAMFLGSLMCLNTNQSYWLSIVTNNDLWTTPEHNKVMSILKLSYNNLAPPLKQCFSYCCIFPKDWEIKRGTLIRLWRAEGFLLPSGEKDKLSSEERGNKYFEDLVWSSFFEVVEYDESGDIVTCNMHDLVHDLAASVLDCDEFVTAEVWDQKKEEVAQVRRLQLLFHQGQRLPSPELLSNAKKVQTIVSVNPVSFSHVSSFFHHGGLRVLCPLDDWFLCSLSCGLNSCKLCSHFSSSKLKHLRYLDLSYLDLSNMVSLKHSYNLETLVLQGCSDVPSWLLKEIVSLESLRYLDISSLDIEDLPEDIGLLENLSFLDLTFSLISKLPDSITSISSLKTLKITDCGSLDALPRDLGALTGLTCLDLRGTGVEVLPESCINNLCNLEVVEFGERCELPKEIKNWPKLRIFTHSRTDVMPGGMDRLGCLQILRPYRVSQERDSIEDLADLNSLLVLTMSELENVKGGKEGAERAKLKDKKHLGSLGLVWEGYTFDDNDDDEVRTVEAIRVLEGLQPHHNLEKILIDGFPGFNLPNWMIGCSLSNCLPNLVDLRFLNVNNIEHLPALGMLPFLRVLILENMKSIKSLGEEFYYEQENEAEEEWVIPSLLFPSLVSLSFKLVNIEEWTAPRLSSSSSLFPSLGSICMDGCKSLRTTPMICFSSLKELVLRGTNDAAVNSLLDRKGEECLTSLTTIRIFYSPGLTCLPPMSVLLQHNTVLLQVLEVRNCSNFQGFRPDGEVNNSNTSSLQSLILIECPVLTCLPDLRLCTSLRELTIKGCDKLNIPYDLEESLTFVEFLDVDFIKKDDEPGDPFFLGFSKLMLSSNT